MIQVTTVDLWKKKVLGPHKTHRRAARGPRVKKPRVTWYDVGPNMNQGRLWWQCCFTLLLTY
jgi:hypothetical protein